MAFIVAHLSNNLSIIFTINNGLIIPFMDHTIIIVCVHGNMVQNIICKMYYDICSRHQVPWY